MSNFSHNFYTSYENWLALKAFLKMEHFAKDEFSRESYWAGWTAGYILNQLLITQSDDEFDLEPVIDPYTTLANYKPN